MKFFRNLRAQFKRGLVLATAAFGLLGLAVAYHQDLMPWAWARSSEPDKGYHAFRQTETAFQTLSDFINRSPGERGEIDSLKGVFTKGAGPQEDRSSLIPRSQRALGKVFEPDPLTIDAAQQGPIVPLTSSFADAGTPMGLIPLVQTGGGSSRPGNVANTIPGSVIFGPDGSSSSGGGGSGSGGGENPSRPPTSAVPEPSAWALLLVGFFGAGFALRKGRTKDDPRRQLVGS
jgi:hypothetical protein